MIWSFQRLGLLAAITLAVTGCHKPPPNRVQGYIEGEFVHVAAPLAGQLTRLRVERGAEVAAGELLFELDDAAERAACDEAAGRLAQARAVLDDSRKGLRTSEIEAMEAELASAKAALEFSTHELARQENARRGNAVAERDLESARSLCERDRELVRKLTASLETARLGAREDQVREQAALAQAEWKLAQKKQSSPAAGKVTDVVFREGDFVAAGSPVVVLLPPGNIKIRAFAPQGLLEELRVGGGAEVRIDGAAQAVPATIVFISPRAEFTPPVIYSQEMREKLVFRVDLAVAPELAAGLHPGQPVDVDFAPANQP
ncbi:MAG: HlyD family efflux transporter periplasmic adaptor subunit [Akkermansiaceae bacterium]|nr:HlyD family efflux transporter periplasmic adaptor subunit [Akkermansiaceae bacterium]